MEANEMIVSKNIPARDERVFQGVDGNITLDF